jgi:hypothetical protein
MDIEKFQLKRVNPFQGLVIDADTWQDAHNYHRDQQRLHVLTFHDTGIVSGLEVTAFNPPESSVSINSGIAIDPDGNVILVPQKQRYQLQTHRNKGTVYLIIQFREIPGEPFQPPEGGQPTRILEAYRIQEREHLPPESYVELARIDFDPAQLNVKDASNASKPSLNEIDLRYRKNAKQTPTKAASAAPAPSPVAPTPASAVSVSASKETILIGHLSVGESPRDLHVEGLRSLVKELNRQNEYRFILEDQIALNNNLKKFRLIYITGNGRFELTAEQQSALGNYVQSGGRIFGDGCSRSSGVTDVKGEREFGLAFNRFASRLNCKLGIVKRGHPLLKADYVFSETPQGCESAMLLEGGSMICSSSDYGCAWDGGRDELLLSREIIRSACEMGCNIVSYALRNV